METKKQVFKVHAKYKYGHRVNNGRRIYLTGHWVMAESEDKAIEIAKKHKIGFPIGTDMIEHYYISKDIFEFGERYKAKVWAEINGELVSYDTPLNKGVPS